jgi:hypothetical protein
MRIRSGRPAPYYHCPYTIVHTIPIPTVLQLHSLHSEADLGLKKMAFAKFLESFGLKVF